MKTIVDLRNKQDTELHDKLKRFYGEEVNVITLFDKTINACIGCWDCWLKTPGECVMKDDMSKLYSDYINSSNVILLMDTAQGFINHKAKAFLDRTITHYLPYIELVKGECHHVRRYKKYPDLTFYFDTKDLSEKEEQVIEDYLYRTAFHFKSKGYRLMLDEGYEIKPLTFRKPKNKHIPYQGYQSDEKLIIYNGSPRKSNSNSGIILQEVSKALKDRVEIRDLKDTKQWEVWQTSFNKEKRVMFFLPLYVHAMPSHVMAFIEKLKPSEGSISFFVQSGFPESSQSYYLEAYFELLSQRLKRHYGGTAIKGGMEGLQMRPIPGQVNMVKPLVHAIESMEEQGVFNREDLNRLAIPIKFGWFMRFAFRLIGSRLMNRFFWNAKLKRNNAYEMRYNKPFSL